MPSLTNVVPALAALIALGCAAEAPDDSCAAAASRFVECTGNVPPDFEQRCHAGDAADEVLAADCSTLEESMRDLEMKNDGAYGWLEYDQSCLMNWTCIDPYVCRPTRFGNDTLGVNPEDRRCREKAGYQKTCDDTSDCLDSMECLAFTNILGLEFDSWRCAHP